MDKVNLRTENEKERNFMFHNSATRAMETSQKKKGLRFGDLIAAVYDACGKRRARGILRLAVNARLVAFLGPQRFLISKP